jgi:hypothetical protein
VVEESVVEEKNPVTETAPLVVSKEKTPVAEETNAADASNVENNESKPSIT